MPKDRFARDIIAKAGAMANKPQFFASRRIVGISRLRSRADQLFFAVEFDYGWGGIRFSIVVWLILGWYPTGFVGPFCDPAGLAGLLFQRSNELIVHPVVREKQQFTIDDRAGGSAHPMVAIQVTTLPEFFAGFGVQTGGAVGAEMHIDSPLFNNRGRGCLLYTSPSPRDRG